MIELELVLKKTYYENGYFNIPLSVSNKYLNNNKGECKVKIKKEIFLGSYKEANKNRQMRVFCGKKLKKYFQNNYKESEKIVIELILEEQENYKTYIEKKFKESSSRHYKESLEIAKDFLVLWSMYEGSFKLENSETLNIPKTLERIKQKKLIIQEIDEIYKYFKKRYKEAPEKLEKLFNPPFEKIVTKYKEYLFNENANNLEKQLFMSIVANRYRNNVLHANKKYFNWYKYKNEFKYINEFLYLWLKNVEN